MNVGSLRKNKIVLNGQLVSETFEVRFLSKIDKNGPLHPTKPELGRCWLWTRSCNRKGYGSSGIYTGRSMAAHRAAWLLFRGAIPTDQNVCHSCDNPPCVNPAHLFLGTQRDNVQDSVAKGRWPSGASKENAKLTSEQVRQIRERFPDSGLSQRAFAARLGINSSSLSRLLAGKSYL